MSHFWVFSERVPISLLAENEDDGYCGQWFYTNGFPSSCKPIAIRPIKWWSEPNEIDCLSPRPLYFILWILTSCSQFWQDSLLNWSIVSWNMLKGRWRWYHWKVPYAASVMSGYMNPPNWTKVTPYYTFGETINRKLVAGPSNSTCLVTLWCFHWNGCRNLKGRKLKSFKIHTTIGVL